MHRVSFSEPLFLRLNLGYDKHDPAGRGSGNSRNGGTTAKTVLADVGAVGLAMPRDRNGSFEPQIVRKARPDWRGPATGSSPCMRGA
jgi:transposase-like protein